MWAIVNKTNNSVTEVIENPKSVLIDNMRHPKSIFTALSWSDLNAIGVYKYVEATNKPDDRFYTIDSVSYTFNSSSKTVTPTYSSSALPLADSTTDGVTTFGLKTQAKNNCKTTATNLINRFSWLVERSIYDSSKTIPSAVSTYVGNVRSKCDSICTAIDNCANISAFEGIHDDGTVNDWPDDSNVESYKR